ncbi:MAG: nuclear transport factor 2 family protein [Trebonia sp.]
MITRWADANNTLARRGGRSSTDQESRSLGHVPGKENVREAFQTWQHIQDETYTITEIQWIATNYWVSACTYKFKSDGTVDGKRQVCEGKGTNVLRRIHGSWRITHAHLSR